MAFTRKKKQFLFSKIERNRVLFCLVRQLNDYNDVYRKKLGEKMRWWMRQRRKNNNGGSTFISYDWRNEYLKESENFLNNYIYNTINIFLIMNFEINIYAALLLARQKNIQHGSILHERQSVIVSRNTNCLFAQSVNHETGEFTVADGVALQNIR